VDTIGMQFPDGCVPSYVTSLDMGTRDTARTAR
jgi:hypothetical protein